VQLRFEICDDDFGSFRSQWADHKGQPNLLEVSAKHESVRRYLGAAPEFAGQDSPVFRVLLAEIIAEGVCRKVLRLEAQERPWDFNLADLGEDRAIVDQVMLRLHRRVRDFIAQAHAVMLSNAEVKALASVRD
jgi:hypothetical protein